MASNVEKTGLASKLLTSFLTATPITLISLASCVSYAHLMEPITFHRVPQLSVSFLSSASIFSAGFANLIHNLASNCPFLITCPDITFTLFLQAGQRSISHLAEAGHSTAFVALHLHALLLGMVLWACGWFTPRIMASLRYLPYPVVAGFLAMIGAAVIMGAFKILLGDPDNESRHLATVIAVFFASTVLGLKLYGVRTSNSAPLLIIAMLTSFYGWAGMTGHSKLDLAELGWLSPASTNSEPPVGIFLGWSWPADLQYVMPSFDSLLLLLVATIMRALTVIAIESALADEPYSVDGEMWKLGLATAFGGLVGGVPMNATSAMTDLNKEGVKGDPRSAFYTAVIISALHLLMWGSGFPLVDYLPRFLLGGLLMQMGGGMLLDWAVLVTRRVQWSGTVVIWAMVGISVFSDITHGIALGLVLAVGFISLRLTKLEVLKYHVTGIHFRSGALYSDAQRSILKKYGDRTQVVGLTGFVFEGVAIAFATYLKEVVRGSQDLKTLVIDCAACQGMNDSACSHFLKVAQMCASKDVALVFCSLSPYDEMLLLSWNLAPYGCRIVPSVSEALEDAEHDTLRDLLQPVTPTLRTGGNEPKIQALERWLGKGTVQELLGIGEFCTFETNEVISGQDAIIDALLITVPGFSDVQIEVQTGTQNKPARLLRTSHGAVCPAEALIGSHCRGRWVANDETVGFLIKPVQALKSSSKRHAFATLSSIALHQQMLQTDQLSAMYTLSKGGGWRGVTFDASTSKRPVKALEGFGPRLRSSHAKRKEFARVGSRATAAESSFDVGKLSTPPAKDRPRAATNTPDDEIPVAAVLDFQRFVSSSGRPSLGSAEADEIIDKAESTRTLSDNVVFNRYSVSQNLNLMGSMATLAELEFEEQP